jgi:ABC-2 type transport system permease protein
VPRHNVFTRALRDARRRLVWWSVGLIGYVAVIAAVWPSVRTNEALLKLHDTYPESLKAFAGFGGEFDFSTPAGYLGAELFSVMLPLLLLVAGIGGGARALAGEEERGTLELLLAQPVSRRRVALEKLAALALELTTLAGVLFLALWASTAAASMRISPGHLLAATTAALLLALAYAAIALVAGAATGRRATAIAVPSALAVCAYLVNGLAPLVDLAHSIRKLSPWYHYAAADPLRDGLGLNTLVLVAIVIAATVLVPFVLDRRDFIG